MTAIVFFVFFFVFYLFYQCSGLRACCHDGCTRHTSHKGSRRGFCPSHMTFSTVTNGQANSNCSDFSSPHEVPYPCPSTGTAPCFAFLPCDRLPERRGFHTKTAAALLRTHYGKSHFNYGAESASLPVWTSLNAVWVHPAASTGWA